VQTASHGKNCAAVYCNSVTVDDFRGVSISPTISKIFEHCILDRYSDFLITSDNQFGFKKGSSYAHAIYSLRCVVDHYVDFGSTVNNMHSALSIFQKHLTK